MFTLVLPDLLRPNLSEMPTLNVPYLNQILRFATFQAAKQSRSQLYFEYLGLPKKLNENQVFASPMWQQMGMNSATILSGQYLDISLQEAQQLCHDLNQFYVGEYVFQVLRPDLWLLTLPEKITWQATCVLDMAGQMFGMEIADGDNQNWLKLTTEIQMFLHHHQVNHNRPMAINGIWLWNKLPEHLISGQTKISLLGTNSVWANHPNLQAAPFDWSTWKKVCEDNAVALNNTAVFLDDLSASLQTGDVWSYAQTLADWDTRWFAPLLNAVRSGEQKAIQIICEQGSWTLTKRSHWAFWRKKIKFNGTFQVA